MKRPLAYITAPWGKNEFENTENAAKYCRAVYDAGFSPVCPLLFLPLSFIPMEVRTVVLVLMAAPSAARCTLQCQKHSMNDVYASGIFAMTTILSMAAMPAVVKLFTTLLELVSA